MSSEVSQEAKWARPVQSIGVLLPTDGNPVMQSQVHAFSRQISKRCQATVIFGKEAECTLNLAIDISIGKEGYDISDGKDGSIVISGNDELGLLHGLGKFLRTSRYDQGRFSPGAWRGHSVPDKPYRGMYWATHYRNTYEVAPFEFMEEYIEELGLWGYNTILMWYDMSFYKSFDDPESIKFLNLMIAYGKKAQSLGMRLGLTDVANHSYDNSAPPEVRAAGGLYGNKPTHEYFHVCPQIPGGMDYLIELKDKYYNHLKDNGLSFESVIIWGFDDGGCTCELCRPWDSNGYIKCAEKVAAFARTIFGEDCEIGLSSWGVDFTDAYPVWQEEHPLWLNYIVYAGERFVHSGKLPPNVLPLNFPDVCNGMRLTVWNPRGGFGANPTPKTIQEDLAPLWKTQEGGLPYSEGIWEDIDKAIVSQLYWDADREVKSILEEYIAYEYTGDEELIADAVEAMYILESNSKQGKSTPQSKEFSKGGRDAGIVGENSIDALELLKRVDEGMPDWAKTSWRWRILILRAIIDVELHKSEGDLAGQTLEDAFTELRDIFYYDERPVYVGVPMLHWDKMYDRPQH